ncbi:uncharacterized protein TrAFT101_008772 [Trichoderma asperellum]|uniref:uncharacterized protein n=1 Tax=Trichoderma asperellum TaxID=101201 RepID=UPI003318765D|nr:hypothetical protein TrAFT101_008772 [Trichoderma asperellum]
MEHKLCLFPFTPVESSDGRHQPNKLELIIGLLYLNMYPCLLLSAPTHSHLNGCVRPSSVTALSLVAPYSHRSSS